MDAVTTALVANAAAIVMGVIWIVRRLTKIETDVEWLIAQHTRRLRGTEEHS